MEKLNKDVVLVLLALMLVCFEGSRGVELCNLSGDDLMECKPAVTAPNPETPSAKCCTAIQNADLACLCGYKNSSQLYFLGIDPDLALALPAKCNLTNPPGC